MAEALAVGIEGEKTFTVSAEMAPGHLPVAVLSTPAMIGLIETTCLESVQPALEGTQTTVGTHVNVSHTGPANEGEEIRIKVRLEEIDRRRLNFKVEVFSPRGSISTGTHQRAVVDLSRFG